MFKFTQHLHLRAFAPLMICTACLSCASTQIQPSTPPVPTQDPTQVQAPTQVQDPTQVQNSTSTTAPNTPQHDTPSLSPRLASLHHALQRKAWDELDRMAHEILDENPASGDAAEALHALAISHLARHAPSTARLYAQNAFKLAPDNPDILLTMARIARTQQAHDEALKYLDSAADHAPTQSEALVLKAAILLEFLDTPRALEAATEAIRRTPDACHAKLIHADALYAGLQYQQAADAYENARSCPLPEDALKNIAKIYELHLQNPAKACEAYTELSQKIPDNDYYKASRDYQCGL